LRQLAHADEVLRKELADPKNEVVAVLGPVGAGSEVADVVRHGGGARREDRDVRTAVALELELRLHRLAELIVGDAERPFAARLPGLEAVDLFVAERLELLGRGREVTVAVDNHDLKV
jgi:hypothetical protein